MQLIVLTCVGFGFSPLIAMLASMLVMEGGEMGSWAGPLSATPTLEASLLDRP